ncbi:MAG: NAD-dependent epimerase/dehydratase family protein, partial [Candidatus Daviesbacteria bacterium GW2011_GWB1_39_5]
AKTVDEVVGNKEGVNFVENSDKAYLKDNPQRRVPNLGKIQKTIDWTPRIPLAEGLRRTICFYKGDKE